MCGSRRLASLAGLIVVMSVPPSPAGAGDQAQALPATAIDSARPTDLFGRGGLGIEFAGGVFTEAWNLNDRKEWLADGTASVWWAFAQGWMLVTEFHATRVFQSPSRAAFVQGVTPLVRWRVIEPAAWSLFVDLGPGISWSDTAVPPRGTRFNYLLLAGAGLSRPLGRQSHAIVGFRWLHVSNNGREGRVRNPDIEAIGAYAGISLVLSP